MSEKGGKIEATTAICSADCQNHSISAILHDLCARKLPDYSFLV